MCDDDDALLFSRLVATAFLSRTLSLMVYPFVVGVGVAAAAMAARGALHVVEVAKTNPELQRQMMAAAAGFRGMSNAIPSLSAIFSRGAAGFDATMSRREAAQILGIRCAARSRSKSMP